VRQAEAVCGGLLRTGDQDGCDHHDLSVRGASGVTARPARHALRTIGPFSRADGLGFL
jgi:hypothetical protein